MKITILLSETGDDGDDRIVGAYVETLTKYDEKRLICHAKAFASKIYAGDDGNEVIDFGYVAAYVAVIQFIKRGIATCRGTLAEGMCTGNAVDCIGDSGDSGDGGDSGDESPWGELGPDFAKDLPENDADPLCSGDCDTCELVHDGEELDEDDLKRLDDFLNDATNVL